MSADVGIAASNDTTLSAFSPEAQVRRAWLVLALAFAVFATIGGTIGYGAFWVYRNATVPEAATLEVISGDAALIRSPTDRDWRLVTGTTRVREGDRLSTALGTVVQVTMFDGSTVEVTEDTVVRVVEMRSSRFLSRTKLIVLQPLRGTIYVNMADRGDYRFSETIVRAPMATVSMADGDGQPSAGSFLVEVRRHAGVDLQPSTARVAVLSGAATVETPTTSTRLASDQQVRVVEDGSISRPEPAIRELIENGDFQDGLDRWVEFQDPSGSRAAAAVELARDIVDGREVVAVELLRGEGTESAVRTGVRQRIGKTLRVHSSLVLDFEVKVGAQLPVGGGETLDQFPLVIELDYLDVNGAERRWTHAYYAIPSDERPVPDEIATRIEPDRWQR